MAGEPMARMRKDPISSKQVFLWVMVISVIFVLLPQRLTDRLDRLFNWVSQPLTSGVRDLTLSVSNKLDLTGDSLRSSPSTDQLETEIIRQQNQLVHLSRELERLKETNSQLAGLRREFGMARASFILADVVGSDTQHRREFLNQGSGDNVKIGQLVLALPLDFQGADEQEQALDVYQMCVVGQIGQTATRTSTLRLINDRGFCLPVIVEPSAERNEPWRANGILQGQSMGEIVVNMIEIKEYPIQAGDRVLAGSNPRMLPIEMMIGRVQLCQPDKDNPVLWHITVKPLTDLHALQRVIVVDTQWDE